MSVFWDYRRRILCLPEDGLLLIGEVDTALFVQPAVERAFWGALDGGGIEVLLEWTRRCDCDIVIMV